MIMASKNEIIQVLKSEGLRNIDCVYDNHIKNAYAENLRYDRNTGNLYDINGVIIDYDRISGLRRKDTKEIKYFNDKAVHEIEDTLTPNPETLFNIAMYKGKIEETFRKNNIRSNRFANLEIYHGIDCVYYDREAGRLAKGEFININNLGAKIRMKNGTSKFIRLEDIKGLYNSHSSERIYENKFFEHNDLELEPEKSKIEQILDKMRSGLSRLQNTMQQFLSKPEKKEVKVEQEKQEQKQEKAVKFVSQMKNAEELLAEGKKERDKIEEELGIDFVKEAGLER